MKKIILSSIIGLCFLTPTANAIESDFFVKANVAYSKLDKTKGLKSKKDIAFGVGLGYNYLENVRLDLTFDHFVNPKFASGNKWISGDVNSLLLNGMIDIVDISIAKIFIGVGAGVGQTQATVAGDTVVANNGKAKQEYSVAYAAYLGSTVEFAPGLFAELAYSYRYIGETKKLNNSDIKFKGQHLSAGLRFDL
jgi:opacity protein-like surface antigen